LPIAAYAHWEAQQLTLQGRVCSLDGIHQIEVCSTLTAATMQTAYALGVNLAQEALDQGAKTLIEQGASPK
jgi:porphobilinogen deaminase